MKTRFLGVFQVKDAEVIEDENAFPVSAPERRPSPSGNLWQPICRGNKLCNRWLEGTEKMQTSFRER